MNKRKSYIDNIRWITTILVIIYHIIYVFNCSNVVSNIDVRGIPILDSFCVFVYPWFMCLLFVISGISSKYALNNKTSKEFIKDRSKRILIPSIVGIFLLGWISGMSTNYYNDIFMGNASSVPAIIKYIIYCLIGIGPLWYCHVLYIACLLLVLLKKIDKQDKLSKLCNNIKPIMLIPLFLLVWLSSFILNTPVITVYRFGIYLLMFFLGYYVFSNEKLLDNMKNLAIPLILITLIIGIIYTINYYGQNYTLNNVLQNIFTNLYLYIAIISILVFGKKYLNFNNNFSKYMNNNNFSFYILHYPLIICIGFILVNYFNLPFIFNYIIILISIVILLPILSFILKRIPILNKLLLGVK